MLKRLLITVPLAVLVLSSPLATPWGAAVAADAEAGAAIATTVCAACHGQDGNSIAPTFPNLAGQAAGYTASQLAKMKSGERAVPEMTGFVANLSTEDMQNLGAYYAAQTAKPASIPESDLEAAESGERIYRGGLKQMQVAACMSCHGPNGHGVPQIYPRVANQHRDYLRKQLLAYKSGQRVSEGGIMNEIAFKLSEQQIDGLAAYMHALAQ